MVHLIGFILFFAIFLVFIVLNLENVSDVHIGFKTFENAPVYITAFISFLLGMLCAVPIIATVRKKKKARSGDLIGPGTGTETDAKTGRLGKKKKPSANDQIPGENGPYGID